MLRTVLMVFACLLTLNCRSNRARSKDGFRTTLSALSLKGAERRARRHGERALARVAGITHLHGLVFDRANRDVVLIGSNGEKDDPLSFDDLVVAMRAVLAVHEWPLVSIDGTPETRQTRKQIVRFEGGLDGTGFGRDLLAADVTLKKLALGLIALKDLRLLSYFDLCANSAQISVRQMNGRSRLWFFAMDPALEQREDVFAIRELNVGVRAEAIGSQEGGKTQRDDLADEFAGSLTSAYPDLSRQFPEIGRLRRLYQAVALARGMQSLPDADLNYWLKEYRLPKKETLREFPVLTRTERVKTSDGVQSLELSGGIQLEALIVRLEDGDITALKEIVTRSRPSGDAFTWAIPLEGWALGSVENPVLSRRSVNDPRIGTSVSRRFIDGPDSGSGTVYAPPALRSSGTMLDPVTGSFKNAPANVEIVEPGSSPAKSRAQATKTAAAQTRELKDEIVRMVDSVMRQPRELKPILNYQDGAYYTNDAGKTNYRKDSTLGYESTDGGKTNFLKNSTLKPQSNAEPAGKATSQPTNSGSGSGGFLCLDPRCVGPVQNSVDGLHAKPFVEGGRNASGQQYVNAGYRVYRGDTVIDTVQGDVKLLDNGLYAKRDNTASGYRVIDSSSGKQVSKQQYTDVQTVGGGFFSVPTSTAGFGMRDIVDANMKVVYSYPAYAVPSYLGDGRVKLHGLNDQYIDLPKTQSTADTHPQSEQPAQQAHGAATAPGSPADHDSPKGGVSLGAPRDFLPGSAPDGWKPPEFVDPRYSPRKDVRKPTTQK